MKTESVVFKSMDNATNNDKGPSEFKKWFTDKGFMVVIVILITIGVYVKDYMQVHTTPVVKEQSLRGEEYYTSNKFYLKKRSTMGSTKFSVGDDVYIQVIGNKTGIPYIALAITAIYDIDKGRGRVDTLFHTPWKFDFKRVSIEELPRKEYYRINVDDSHVPQLIFYSSEGDSVCFRTYEYGITGFYGYQSRYLNSYLRYEFLIPISRQNLTELRKRDITKFSLTPTFSGTEEKTHHAIADAQFISKIDECYQLIEEKQNLNFFSQKTEKGLLFVLSNPSSINMKHCIRMVTMAPMFLTKDLLLYMTGILDENNKPQYMLFLQHLYLQNHYNNDADIDYNTHYISFYPDSANKNDIKNLKLEPTPYVSKQKPVSRRNRKFYNVKLSKSEFISENTMLSFINGQIAEIGCGKNGGSSIKPVKENMAEELKQSFRSLNGYLYSDVPYSINSQVSYNDDYYNDLLENIRLIMK